jgi:hypothetical protein
MSTNNKEERGRKTVQWKDRNRKRYLEDWWGFQNLHLQEWLERWDYCGLMRRGYHLPHLFYGPFLAVRGSSSIVSNSVVTALCEHVITAISVDNTENIRKRTLRGWSLPHQYQIFARAWVTYSGCFRVPCGHAFML